MIRLYKMQILYKKGQRFKAAAAALGRTWAASPPPRAIVLANGKPAEILYRTAFLSASYHKARYLSINNLIVSTIFSMIIGKSFLYNGNSALVPVSQSDSAYISVTRASEC